ncbi:PAS domain S-box protein [Microvirga makkahensis]|uniref:Blue-light-activated histidine kinase n=2 Tax=Microvirga makkahensis TaxID=1128670 RepID=A0A7X3MSV9_9HYPH|nr:PAS domain S-box protein [Microvirga makkahensis]
MPPSSTQNISLPSELLRLIDEDVASGRYRSASEALRAALRSFYRERMTPEAPHTFRVNLAMTRSEQEVEALFAQAAAGMAQVDLTGRFVRVNNQYCAILGRHSDELLQLRMQDCTHRDDLPHNMVLFRRALETGEAFEIEKRYLRPDGSVVWVRNAVSPILDSSGKPDSILAVSIDITGYRNAQQELRESEALKGSILDAALDCIVSINHESNIIEWNTAAERTFGYSREAALGRDLAELIIPPEFRERHRQGMVHYLATGKGPVLNRRIELEAVRADGSRFPVELAISPISSGDSPRFTAYLRDITLNKQVEAAQRETEQRLRSTYEHAFTSIAEVDASGRFLRVNEQLSIITGYSREELLGRTFIEITHPDDRGADLDQFRRQMAGELDAYALEKRYVRKDGSTVWIELSASRVDDGSGKPLYGIRVARDITERKRAEEHQRLLINELNHRVKNTLTTVQSIVFQTLRNAPTPEDAQTALSSRLIALSKAHDVLTRESWEAASLHQIVLEAMEPFRAQGESRIRVAGPEVRLPPSMALAVAMALQELATNAVKYGSLSNETGKVELRWSLDKTNSLAHLHLRWEESGGPPVRPPSRRGFGTRLIERSLAGDLQGEAKIEFALTGVVCTITAPVPDPIGAAV